MREKRRLSERITQPSRRHYLIRTAGLAGSFGPVTLGLSIIVLSFAQYEFMRNLGWHPLRAPTLDWPSGLALGPYGKALSAAFVLCGLLLSVFAVGLAAELRTVSTTRRLPDISLALLAVSGLALALLAFDTDPTLGEAHPTWHGRLHDGAFLVLGLTLLPALTLLGLWMARDSRRHSRWRTHGFYTLFTALLATICFLLRGVAFYLFLIAVLCWFVATARRLRNA